MRLLFLGDIVGRAGRDAVTTRLPAIRQRLGLDFVIVNGENAAHGFGITAAICDSLFAAGVDVITTGNHVWDQREALSHVEKEPRLLRPVNFPAGTPGHGAGLYSGPGGVRILVVSVMGRLFMEPLDHPFRAVEAVLGPHRLGRTVAAVVIDIHAEASSEKAAFGHRFDGRASLVVGTHTHVPTADYRILAGGTAFQTDAGMCGDYDSVIGMKKTEAVRRFIKQTPGSRLEPASGDATLCGLFLETDRHTGLATRVVPLRLGGGLDPVWPPPGPAKPGPAQQ